MQLVGLTITQNLTTCDRDQQDASIFSPSSIHPEQNSGNEANLHFNTGEVLTEFERDIFENLVHIVLPTCSPQTIKSVDYIRQLVVELFDSTYRKELALAGRLIQIKRIMFACVVRQIIVTEQWQLPTYEELQDMPFFKDPNFVPTTVHEINCLRRFMRAAQVLQAIGLSGANNKQTYVEVCAMLDGSNQTYAFGGAPSKATVRRAVIFHVVSGIPLTPKFRRLKRSYSDNDNQGTEI